MPRAGPTAGGPQDEGRPDSPARAWRRAPARHARLADCRARHPESRSGRILKAVRLAQFGGPEVLEIVDLPDPHPGPGQVRIAVRAAGVNPSDWKKRKGLMDGELPQTLGYEAAGVVDELGEGVADAAVGDRVFGFSAEGAAQAELAVLSWYAPIPPRLTSPALQPCRPPSRRPRAPWTRSASGAAARCSSAAPPETSAAPRFSLPWCAARASSAPPVPPTTATCARWGPSPSPTARAWSGGFARSRPTASTPRSTSPGAASCPSSSNSRAVRGTW